MAIKNHKRALNYETEIADRSHSAFGVALRALRNGGAIGAMVPLAATATMIPGAGWAMLPLALAIGSIAAFGPKRLWPLYKPMYLGGSDARRGHLDFPDKDHDLRSAAINFYGNVIPTGQQAWTPNDVETAHKLILGTTGAGKTEAILTDLYNSMLNGGGGIVIDGKAEVNIADKVYGLAHRMGRAPDVSVLSFMTGSADMRAASPHQATATFNPLAYGSSSFCSELLKSMLASASGDGGNWLKLGEQFLDSLVRVLVYARDVGLLKLTVGAVRRHLELPGVTRLFELINSNRAVLEQRGVVVPDDVLDGLVTYVRNIPGIPQEAAASIIDGVYPERLAQTILDQHGYRAMQLVPVLSMLADEYGHIFEAETPDIDIWDVLVNRKILVVLLPALEKSPSSLSNLGKVVLAAVKSCLSMALGFHTEGDVQVRRQRAAMSGRWPFRIICDEVGFYFVDGIAVTAAQARSLGVGFSYGAQDIPGLRRENPKEADMIIGNTGLKLIGKIEDPKDTMDVVTARGGAEFVKAIDGEEIDEGLNSTHVRSRRIKYERRDAITIRDLETLKDGRWYVIHSGERFVMQGMSTGSLTKRIKHTFHNSFLNCEGLDSYQAQMLRSHRAALLAATPESTHERSDAHTETLSTFLDAYSECTARIAAGGDRWASIDAAINAGVQALHDAHIESTQNLIASIAQQSAVLNDIPASAAGALSDPEGDSAGSGSSQAKIKSALANLRQLAQRHRAAHPDDAAALNQTVDDTEGHLHHPPTPMPEPDVEALVKALVGLATRAGSTKTSTSR